MARFDSLYAHDVLIPIAEAAYFPLLEPNALPSDYSIVGPIKVSPLRAAAFFSEADANMEPCLVLARQMRKMSDTFGWVIQNTRQQILIISFRGTSSLEDWLRNLDFFPCAYEPVPNFGSVHKGFHAVYRLIRESLFAQLRQADPKFTRLIVTGHSLGAALSELAAPDLLYNSGFAVVPEVQNFAGPRVGHADFARAFDAQIDTCFRIVNTWDLVPHLPPPLALFEHPGIAVRIDGGFTLDEFVAHSLDRGYIPGLAKLIPHAATRLEIPAATENFVAEMLIGREP